MNEDIKRDELSEESNDLLELAGYDDPVPVEEVAPTRLSEVEPQISEPVRSSVPPNRSRKVYSGMWGGKEIAAVGLGLLAILIVSLIFLLIVVPAKKELEKNRADRNRAEEELAGSREKYGSITDTESHVAKLIESVDGFESRFLRIPANGKSALYEQINGLIGAYGLVNTAGPDYSPLEVVDPLRMQPPPEGERGRDKLKSLFPGVYVTVTVEGTYQDLRRFLRKIETSEQFIMISAVELIPADSSTNKNPAAVGAAVQNPGPNSTEQAQPSNPDAGKKHGEKVSLKLEMAAYFSRKGTLALENPVSQN